jgi:hypothetical protein
MPTATGSVMKSPKTANKSTDKLPRKSGYDEPHPRTNERHNETPDANTPHEPQNVPARKPLPSSS